MAKTLALLFAGALQGAALDVKCGSYHAAVTANCTFIRMLTSGYIERRDPLPMGVCDGTGRTAADLGTNAARSASRYLFYTTEGGADVHQIVLDKSDDPLNVSLRASFGTERGSLPLLALSQPRSQGQLYALTASKLYAAGPGSGQVFEAIADVEQLSGLDLGVAVAVNATADADLLYLVSGDALHILSVKGTTVERQTRNLSTSFAGRKVRAEPLTDSSDLILLVTELPHEILTLNVSSGAVSPLAIPDLPTETRSPTRATTMGGSMMLDLLDSEGLLTIGINDDFKTGKLYHELTDIDDYGGVIDTFYLVA